VVHLDEGCDFLGFNIRRYRGKLLTKPSTAALRRIRKRLTAEVLALRGTNAEAVIAKLNPIIKGWAAYYRIGVSKRAFASLDNHLWRLTYKWATFSHPNKSNRWAVARYFGEFNTSRHDQWVFGDRASGRYLTKFAWTPIVRHRMVPGTASTDDPALADFWAKRRRRSQPPLATSALRLLRMQNGRCPLCGTFLLHADHEPQHPDEWEQWFKAVRLALRKQAVITGAGHGTPDETAAPRLVHAHCRRRRTLGTGDSPALLSAREPPGLA
jgi:RNA-directed DNA polymerase